MVLCNQTDDDVIAVVVDAETLLFDESGMEYTGELVVGKISENRAVIREICPTRYQGNTFGQHRFMVQDGELYERDDWEPVVIQ